MTHEERLEEALDKALRLLVREEIINEGEYLNCTSLLDIEELLESK